MTMIRLFTSGTHNGLNFSNAEITDIATKTRQMGDERIPFVLGHPKKRSAYHRVYSQNGGNPIP